MQAGWQNAMWYAKFGVHYSKSNALTISSGYAGERVAGLLITPVSLERLSARWCKRYHPQAHPGKDRSPGASVPEASDRY